jgi:hypothetical protein
MESVPHRRDGIALHPNEKEPLAYERADEYGPPQDGDLRLLRYLREEFKKNDPTWGGLEVVSDGKFGRIWAFPLAEE